MLDQILRRNFPESAARLVSGGIDLHALASECPQPLYAYNQAVLQRQLKALQQALGAFKCLYSIKANPNPAVVSALLLGGCSGLEIASAGELRIALAAGCQPSRIFFAGPGKRDPELAFAVDSQVGEIHLESVDEAHRLSALCASRGVTQEVAIRINPALSLPAGAQLMGGKPTPFGIDEEQMPEALHSISAMAGLRVVGIHVFFGTQVTQASLLRDIYRHILMLGEQACRLLGHSIKTISFGGGFGVPYFQGESYFDLDTFARIVGDVLREAASGVLQATSFYVEPGRFLSAESGVYLTRVTGVKQSRGKHFAILEGGLNHHITASGHFGQTIKRNFPIVVANKLEQDAVRSYDLVGPLCTPLDVVGRQVHLPLLERGDTIAILHSGAYGPTTSSLAFLGHPLPREFILCDGSARDVSTGFVQQAPIV